MALATKPVSNRQARPVTAPTPNPGINRTPQRPVKPGKSRRIDLKSFWRQARTTLRGQFMVLACAGLLLSVLAGIFMTTSFQQSSNYLNTIAVSSVPSVDAAQAMAEYMQDIDAKSADYLAAAGLTEQVPCSLPGTSYNPGVMTTHQCDDLTISAEITLANKELFNAAHNVTFPGERTAVERITAGFESYSGDIAVMRHEYALAASKTDPHDPHLMQAQQAYSAANKILLVQIAQQPTVDATGHPTYNEQNIPSCAVKDPLGDHTVAARGWPLSGIQTNIDCLNSINKGYLDSAYNDTMSFFGYTLICTVLLCLALCLLLGFTTWRMAAMTHRIVNVGLTIALVGGIFFSFLVIIHLFGLSGRNGAYGQMVKDDYDSVYYAAQLKHYGTASNADESRWLIALESGNQSDAAHWQQDWLDNSQRVKLLITRAQNNRTWPEEDQPLVDMQNNWNTYFTIDGQIRSAATNTADAHRTLTAERISTTTSNQAFSKFSTAVDQLSLANRGYFDRTYASEAASLNLYTVLSAILFPLLGLIAVAGIAQRLKDF